MNYNSIMEIPKQYLPVVSRLIENGIITYNNNVFEFTISDEFLAVMMVLARIGLF